MIHQEIIQLSESEDGAHEITDLIVEVVAKSGIVTGICQLFAHKTEAYIIVCDNVDEEVKNDTADFLAQLAPSSDDVCEKIDQSLDSISDQQHLTLSQSSITIPISNSHPAIGVWRGIYLWNKAGNNTAISVTVTVMGE